MCPQTFIVKVRIPVLGRTSTFYSGTERWGNRLVARETEREGVCDFALPENEAGVCCKTAAWERVAMRTYTLKLFVSETI